MLEQKQRVRLLARQNRAFSSFLDFERRCVIDAAETFYLEVSWLHQTFRVLTLVGLSRGRKHSTEVGQPAPAG